jgi:TonB family protein
VKSRAGRIACATLAAVALSHCSSSPTPQVETAPAAQIGTVRVTAATLNVRRDASPSSDVVAQVRKGERLALLSDSDEWMRVRLGNGDTGWVSTQYVIREGARSRRPGCPPDSDYRIVSSPTPSFSEGGTHGLVTVEANVDASGRVLGTRVVSNTTGDQALAGTAEREIRNARFAAPIRNCVARPFIFTYKRAF